MTLPLRWPLPLGIRQQLVGPDHVLLDFIQRHCQKLAGWPRVEFRKAIAIQNCIACAPGGKKTISAWAQVDQSSASSALIVEGGTAASRDIIMPITGGFGVIVPVCQLMLIG
jgi:hypothetical protein